MYKQQKLDTITSPTKTLRKGVFRISNTPFKKLMYLYMGTSDFESDFRYYQSVLGGKLHWAFEQFGAKVAAFELGEGPLLLIADHLNAPSCMPIFEINDLSAKVKELKNRGWQEEKGPIEIPNGPCYIFKDTSGNSFGIFENIRPTAADDSYRDKSNKYKLQG
ncbi:VOC family protein [Bacillus sp. JJ1609]|uniref:VOC family protein n=1 Tax=Bacillus sp. JJ1609 TaxID=3122977 RepID=UPI002FFEE0EC